MTWLRQAAPAAGTALAIVLLVSALEMLFWKSTGERLDWTSAMLGTLGIGAAAAALAGALRIFAPMIVALTPALFLGLVPFVRTALLTMEVRGAPVPSGLAFWGTVAVATACLAAILAALARRRPIRVTVGLLAIVVVIASFFVHSNRSGPRPAGIAGDHPDVILLVLDTTRWDRLSLDDPERPTAPRLAALARSSEVYESAWSVSPWTPPSHASIFTGLLPAEHGVDGEGQPPFVTDSESLTGVLRGAGYRTGGFPANPNLAAPGWERDFDRYQPPWFVGPHTVTELLNRVWLGSKDTWMQNNTTRVLSMARGWWSKNDGRPRFLFVNLLDPHYPYRPPEAHYRAFLPDTSPEEAYRAPQEPELYHINPGLDERASGILRKLYDAEIASMDAELGLFFDWLEERDELNETVLAIVADHGERLGERGLLGHNLMVDRFLLHVPLMVRYPPKVEPARIERRVQTDGLAGYVLELAEVEAPDAMRESALPRQDREIVVAQYQHPDWYLERLVARDRRFDTSPYDGDWLYVADERFAYVASRVGDEVLQGTLTDLVEDPEWSRDVSDAHPQVVARLHEIAVALPSFVEREERELSPEALERLRSLGYAD